MHAIAFANREELKGLFADTSRGGFHPALDVSAYSLVAVTRPVPTLASAGVGGYHCVLDWCAANAPLRRATNQDEVGDTSLLLLSDWGRGISGEVIYVDSGYHIVGIPPAVGSERGQRDQGTDS